MANSANCETWSGIIADGDDLTQRISTELGISKLTILSLTAQADSALMLELSPPEKHPNRVIMMGGDGSYVVYVGNANEGIGVNVIKRIIVRGNGKIVMNFYYNGMRL